jgi:putative acetyltransferase
MKALHRLATLGDAKRLFDLRRDSIVALAPAGMSVAGARKWAANLTVAGMERKIRELEVWVAELNGTVVGWGAIAQDRLEGLYTDPAFAGRGIGTDLLALFEGLMWRRGIQAVRAEASSNAQAFYVRRGYQITGVRTAEGALPIGKRL